MNDGGWPITLPMTPIETEILTSLNELDAMVRSIATADPKPDLLLMFSRLDQLTAKLPPTSDASLMHYMHKKSYEKARLWLQGREAENQRGSCRQ